eukprot:CAMPEP_0113616602 /NCGR_PEP_ID=MMETSP0017_2-20120614/8325_1 /TAXON_ID=2856 /ORGANISM="Cylindrotheca closterium" /LENGTH=511 /DNA_ID=CAMNT_0000525923 /DNA_START=265 /DNA_END=1800 /DNA_ORIENTATION=+ /assembly_acc=CAM_ASM_000147
MSSWIANPRILLTACLLLLFAGSTVEATITVVSTQQKFPSEPVKGIGRHMWKGYEYIARLQYLPHHLDLCDITEPVSVTVPQDSVPVVLLAKTGDCSKEEQARIASTMIKPQNVVNYLILEDSSRKTTTLGLEDDTKDDGDIIEIEDEEVSDEDEDLFFNLLKQGILQDDSIKVAVLKVGRKTYDRLLTIAAMESQTDRESGGTKITMNSKVPNQTARSILAWATMSLAFCCCSCFCVSLAYQHGVFTVETEPEAPPPRPVRRRLTVGQVREMFPSYRFYPGANGPIEEEGDNDEEEGLETSSQMLGECSICLDDFLPGQRVRQLPCGHVFHSTCIARWLVERNAVCPLCKLDVFEEEEEESSSSSEEEEAEADPLVSETPTTREEEEVADQAVASGSRWWSFSSTSSGSAAPGTRWAMRWLSLQRRRGNGDSDMLTEMTNPLLAADRSEAVDVIEFQSPTDGNAESSEDAQEDPEAGEQREEASAESSETPSESSSSSNEGSETSTPVEV